MKFIKALKSKLRKIPKKQQKQRKNSREDYEDKERFWNDQVLYSYRDENDRLVELTFSMLLENAIAVIEDHRRQYNNNLLPKYELGTSENKDGSLRINEYKFMQNQIVSSLDIACFLEIYTSLDNDVKIYTKLPKSKKWLLSDIFVLPSYESLFIYILIPIILDNFPYYNIGLHFANFNHIQSIERLNLNQNLFRISPKERKRYEDSLKKNPKKLRKVK